MSSSIDAARESKVDGRRQRAVVTRQNIVSAAIALQLEGNLRPSLQQISDRAGVALRTVFEHFPERHFLTRAVLKSVTRFDQTDPPPKELVRADKLEDRVTLFLDLRTKRLEELTPHRQVSNALIATWPMLQKHRLKVRKLYRDIVESWFAPELDQFEGSVRQQRLIAIATLVDWEMWWSLRAYPERSVAEARAILHFLLTAALQASIGRSYKGDQ